MSGVYGAIRVAKLNIIIISIITELNRNVLLICQFATYVLYGYDIITLLKLKLNFDINYEFIKFNGSPDFYRVTEHLPSLSLKTNNSDKHSNLSLFKKDL